MPEIRRDRLADQIYEVLKDRILNRQLLPGQKLSVPMLAQELGLSRSPVREAVQRLVYEGLSTDKPRHGAVVAAVQDSDLLGLYQVRAVLEGLASTLAAERVTLELVDELHQLLAVQQAAFESGDGAGVIRADMRFHRRITSAAANPELIHILDPLYGRASIAMLAGDLENWPGKAIPEHEAILRAIEAGDVQAARERSEEHVMRVRKRLVSKLASAVPAKPSTSPGTGSEAAPPPFNTIVTGGR